MVELYLDGRKVDVPEDTSIGLTVSVADIEDPTSASGAFTQSVSIPRTPNNSYIMGFTDEILSPDIFNHSEHTAAIYEDSIELIKGKAYLERVSDTHITIQVVGDDIGWLARIKDKKMSELPFGNYVSQFREYSELSAEQRGAVFFGLVNHGCWYNDTGEGVVPRKWATPADLVPFVNLKAILEFIFDGWQVEITPEVEELLTRLYVTGAWAKDESYDIYAEDNTFEVSSSGGNTADGEGVVGTAITADNHGDEAAYCEVFDIVEDDPNERIVVEKMDDTRKVLYFTSTVDDLLMTYSLRLKYSSEFIIRDNRPIFADTIHLDGAKVAQLEATDNIESNGIALNNDTFDGCAYPETVTGSGSIAESEMVAYYLELSNPELYSAVVQVSIYADKDGYNFADEQIITTNMQEKMYFKAACCFNYKSDTLFDTSTNSLPKSGTRATIGLLTNTGKVVVIGDNNKANMMWKPYLVDKGNLSRKAARVRVERIKDKTYSNATVALYKFTEAEALSFNIQLQTPAFEYPCDEPISLAVGFTSSRATELNDGESLFVSVAEGSSLASKFNGVRPFGYNVAINEVCGDVMATDMLKAIMHLFALRIQSDPDTQTVQIIPYRDYHSEYYDTISYLWSDRIDYDKGIEVTTIGDDIGKKVIVKYKADNPLVEKYNKRHTVPYMGWSEYMANEVTKTDYEIENNLFNPPMYRSTEGIFAATSIGHAKLLDLANSDSEETLDNLVVNELPRTIVQIKQPNDDPTEYIDFIGCTGLLAEYEQPIFVDYDREADTTISFANGLHKYYDKLINNWKQGKRITCYCRVEPFEIESLRKCGKSYKSSSYSTDFRKPYRLKLNGEDVWCYLESVENYEPLNNTHKCTFLYFG